VAAWVGSFPSPQAVTYEAGPTRFGLFHLLTGAGIACLVTAPSKLQRASGVRVEADVRDTLHLARLLRLDDLTVVRVPTVEEETAHDLARSREDTRQDLMAPDTACRSCCYGMGSFIPTAGLYAEIRPVGAVAPRWRPCVPDRVRCVL
jgi:transposase